MPKDPIVEEVRQHRDTLAAKFDYDLTAIVKDARKRQASSGHKVVMAKPRKARKGTVNWLLSCPEKDWFRPIPFESTDTL